MKFKGFFKVLCSVVSITSASFLVTSCNKTKSPEVEPTTETAENYIKARTFGIASIRSTGWYACGTCWIIDDSTPDVEDDYNYWIATNWHVKKAIDDDKFKINIGYHCDGMSTDTYDSFTSISWVNDSKMCYTSITNAVDFHIANVCFGDANSLNTEVKSKLDGLNSIRKTKGYINKFVETTNSSNWCHNNLHVGGYPAKTVNNLKAQKWYFEDINPNLTVYRTKGYKYLGPDVNAGHPIDNARTIWDQSPNYEHQTYFKTYYEEYGGVGEYIPIGWSLSGGASGSMLITAHNAEWCVVGIYWGGWESSVNEKVYFSPAFSLFNTNYKNFLDVIHQNK